MVQNAKSDTGRQTVGIKEPQTPGTAHRDQLHQELISHAQFMKTGYVSQDSSTPHSGSGDLPLDFHFENVKLRRVIWIPVSVLRACCSECAQRPAGRIDISVRVWGAEIKLELQTRSDLITKDCKLTHYNIILHCIFISAEAKSAVLSSQSVCLSNTRPRAFSRAFSFSLDCCHF